MNKLPRDPENDYTREMAGARRSAVTAATGVALPHAGSFSFGPEVLPGNIESCAGVAQIPMGFAGPLRVNGEHAREFGDWVEMNRVAAESTTRSGRLRHIEQYSMGKVEKPAEIVAATVLCGEVSLSSAIVSDQWVSSHDKLGRNPT